MVTYELEHVAAPVVERARRSRLPVRPGKLPLQVTHDRLAERRFVEAEGIAVAPWREVRTADDLAGGASGARLATAPQGPHRRLRRARAGTGAHGWRSRRGAALGVPPGSAALAERELDFEIELSVIVNQGIDGRAVTFRRRQPPRRRDPRGDRRADGRAGDRTHAAAIAPSGWRSAWASSGRSRSSCSCCATARSSSTSWRRGAQHRPLDDRRCRTSQFEQHIRAISGLPLGALDLERPAAMVNLLGTDARRGRPADRHRPSPWATRSSSSTCTTSARSSSAARWAT